MPGRIKTICCIGAGYVGGPTCAVIANKNPDINVTVVDLSQSRIDAWNSSQLPIYEPGLQDVIQLPRDGSNSRPPNLFFSTDVRGAVAGADLVFISVNTPTKTVGVGAGRASDVTYVEEAARLIAEVATNDKIIVEKSTVPCGMAESLQAVFEAVGDPNVRFEVLSNPEFLAEGTAITDLLSPDRVLIGSGRGHQALEAANALADVYAAWVPREHIITVNIWSSELTKLAANCMLAQRISSINSLSAICEATGADIEELANAIGLDNRIGPKFLKASVGFGGSCFKKDVLSLVYIAETLHLPEVAAYWNSVVEINEWQKERFTNRITRALNNTLAGKKVAVLGFAYKKNTGDTRESAAIGCIGQMIAENAKVAIYDPKVPERQIISDLLKDHRPEVVEKCVTVCEDALSACNKAAALVLLTEWDEFRTDNLLKRSPFNFSGLRDYGPEAENSFNSGKNSSSVGSPHWESDSTNDSSEGSQRRDSKTLLSGPNSPAFEAAYIVRSASPQSSAKRLDWARVAQNMRRPRLVFDGRNVVDGPKLEALGFVVQSLGKRASANSHWHR